MLKSSLSSLLIVEDSPDQLQRYSKLVASDFNVSLATNIDEALSKVRSSSIDIVLTDIHLKHSLEQESYEGFDLIRALQSDHPEITILATSSDPKPETYHTALDLGSSAFIKKPILSVDEIHLGIEVAKQRQELKRSRKLLNQSSDKAGWRRCGSVR